MARPLCQTLGVSVAIRIFTFARKGVSQMKKLFLLSMVLLLSACGAKSLEGTYVNSDGEITRITIEQNGKLSMLDKKGKETKMSYTVSGENQLIVTSPELLMPIVLLVGKDGAINSPIMGIFTKK